MGAEKDSPKKPGTRHRARRRAVDLLFEAEARDTDLAELMTERAVLAQREDCVAPIHPYTRTLVEGVAADGEQLDATIESYLQDWTLSRLPAVDRAVLRVAIWELFHAAEVPPIVVVDEAVELAKELSTDDSPAFVNGVLGRAVLLAPQVRAAAAAMETEVRDPRS